MQLPALVMLRMGGEYWKGWNERLVAMLKDTQDTEVAKGSWDPDGEFLGAYGGRLYVTTLNLLNLESEFRAPQPEPARRD